MSRYTSIVSKLAQTPVSPQAGLQVIQAPLPLEENLRTLETPVTPQERDSETESRETGLPENLQSSKAIELQAGMHEQPQIGIPENLQTGMLSNKRDGKAENLQNDEPLKLQAGIPENLQITPPLRATESPLPEPEPRLEKYSTYLESDLSVQLKLFAVSRRLKDYQVVNAALRAYLETQSR